MHRNSNPARDRSSHRSSLQINTSLDRTPSNLRLACFLAVKDLFHDRKLFAMLTAAIIFGVGIQIPNTANLDGAIQAIMDRTVNVMSGHLVVMNENGSDLQQVSVIENELDDIDWIDGYLPRTYRAAIVSANGVSAGVDIIGIRPDREREITDLNKYVVEGRFLSEEHAILIPSNSSNNGNNNSGSANRSSDDNQTHLGTRSLSAAQFTGSAILGDEFAKLLNVEISGVVRSSLPATENFPDGITVNFTVIGITNIGLGGVDERSIFVHSAILHQLSSTGNVTTTDTATELLIRTDDAFNARDYRDRLQRTLASVTGARVYDWKERMAYVDDILDGNTKTKYTSQVMTIIGVVVPVSALMYVNVKSRKREIGIMMATGMPERMIFRIYLIQALIIATLGVFGGTLLGGAICLYYRAFPVVDRANFVVTPYLTAWTFIVPVVVLFAATIISCIYPASKAARINPIDAIWGQ